MNRIFCTLDPNRCDSALSLSQGNLVVTTNQICNINRKVMGSLAFASGTIAFECYVYSNSRPNLGLVDLSSIGVASIGCPLSTFVGGDVTSGVVASCGLRPSNGTGSSTGAKIYANNAIQASFNQVNERQCIGVMLVNDPTTPIVAFQVNGNYLGQFTLPAGLFYAPAISIGSSAAPGDVSAYVNFGQYNLDYPFMSVSK